MFNSKITKITKIAEQTLSIKFEKPKDYNFKAGQFFQIFLKDKNNTTINRYFSIATSPSDNDLEFATRLTGSEFKNILETKNVGNEISFSEPLGKFTVSESSEKPLIILTGGIGITPFRSIILEIKKNGFARKVYLFYSNRNIQSSAYFNEFEKIKNKNFEFIPTMTDDSTWTGRKGYIDENLIKKSIKNFTDSNYMIAGPPSMVKAMVELTKSLKVPDIQVKYEEFLGYK